jgi:hypothetical protein
MLWQVTLDRMRDLVLADRASLFIHDRKRKQLWSKIADDIAEIRLAANAGIVGAVCTSGEALNIEDAYKDARLNHPISSYPILSHPIPPPPLSSHPTGTRTRASTGGSTRRRATARAPSSACQ